MKNKGITLVEMLVGAMIILISALMALAIVSAAFSPSPENSAGYSTLANAPKTVMDKREAIEQRRAFDILSNDPWRIRTETVYYLIATDGTVAEVGLSQFSLTKVGDSFSGNWQQK